MEGELEIKNLREGKTELLEMQAKLGNESTEVNKGGFPLEMNGVFLKTQPLHSFVFFCPPFPPSVSFSAPHSMGIDNEIQMAKFWCYQHRQ